MGTKAKRYVKYAFSLVAHTDILGFQELIENESAGYISKTLRIFKEVVDPNRFPGSTRGVPTQHFRNFSDLCIVAIPIRDKSKPERGAIFQQLLHLAQAQIVLIHDEGVFIRGGVAVGNVAKSYGLLFGPGIIDAYGLESRYAVYPRVVISPQVLEEQKANDNLWVHDKATDLAHVQKMLRKDRDGQLYLDYLRVAHDELDPAHFQDFLVRHAARIQGALKKYADNEKVRRKYAWLNEYHDLTVKRLKTTPKR